MFMIALPWMAFSCFRFARAAPPAKPRNLACADEKSTCYGRPVDEAARTP
jgi:hypothetical protein